MVNVGGTKVADANGRITGSFTIPPNTPAGVKQIEFKGKATKAYATFTGQGTLLVTTLRRVQNIYRHTTTTTTITTTTYVAPVRVYNPDPLAQSFTLETEGQLAGVDLWFAARGTTNAQVQIREMDNGFPTSVVLAEAIVPPDKQIVGGGHTRVLFDAPLPLEAGTEYAIVILCHNGQFRCRRPAVCYPAALYSRSDAFLVQCYNLDAAPGFRPGFQASDGQIFRDRNND